ncbi:hypothetical protein Tco_0911954 [Tanacetum coccineum]
MPVRVASEIKNGKKDLIDIMGLDVVEKVYKDKVKYDKYCLKMLNRRAHGKITNYDVLSRGNGPISLKVYKDDGSNEIINNFQISDLQLGELREMRQKLDALHKTEEELELDLNRPLEEQDLIIKLNILTKKKRKNPDDLHEYFKSTKMYKKLVQFGNFQAGTVLNEPTLRMILFNLKQRQDFINIEDFKELNNDMMYHVHEIFIRLH